MTDYNYKETDCGRYGKTVERSLKDYFNRKNNQVSKPGKVDFRRYRKNVEVKTGGGELGKPGEKLLPNCSYVLFIPVVKPETSFEKQEGFIIPRQDFLEALDTVGLIRSKISTAGQARVSIQTFWNHKLNKPHGAKLFKLLDILYNGEYPTLQEYLEAGGKIQDLVEG